MAYLRDRDRQCDYRCGRRAVVELFNHWNASLGEYCRPCGKRALAEQKKKEGQD